MRCLTLCYSRNRLGRRATATTTNEPRGEEEIKEIGTAAGAQGGVGRGARRHGAVGREPRAALRRCYGRWRSGRESFKKFWTCARRRTRDFDAIDNAITDLASLPAYPDIGFRARGDWRLVWAKSDEGVGFIGTGLHRVPLANLEDQFLSLEADGSCALTEVIRVIGPFPNVKNLLTGTSTIGPSTLRLTYTKVIDGTGAELTSSQARSVKLQLAALKSLLVVAAASIDADDRPVFERGRLRRRVGKIARAAEHAGGRGGGGLGRVQDAEDAVG